LTKQLQGGPSLLSPNKGAQKKKGQSPSYEQATYIVTEEELSKTGGKESIFAQLRKKGEVAFPERKSPAAEAPQLSRIDQLRQGGLSAPQTNKM
jgi:hypothetical protein